MHSAFGLGISRTILFDSSVQTRRLSLDGSEFLLVSAPQCDILRASSLTTYYLLRTLRTSCRTTHYSLLTTYHLLLTTCYGRSAPPAASDAT